MLIMGIVFLATAQEMLYYMFVIACVVYFPIQTIVGMAANEGRWERFQITLPIKRNDLLKVQFLSVLAAAFFGAVILTVGIGISSAIHDAWFNYGFASAIASSLHSYGMALLSIGMLFILGMIVGNMVAWIISGLVPALIQALVPVIADNLGISIYVLSASVLAVSVVVFVAAYFITKAAYRKCDF